jgi:hypothetical protein
MSVLGEMTGRHSTRTTGVVQGRHGDRRTVPIAFLLVYYKERGVSSSGTGVESDGDTSRGPGRTLPGGSAAESAAFSSVRMGCPAHMAAVSRALVCWTVPKA